MPRIAPEQDEPISGPSLGELIGTQVIRSLGRPKDLLEVRVHRVGDDRFRVNVVAGADVTSAKIVNSYFLTADSKGKILDSDPRIVRLY